MTMTPEEKLAMAESLIPACAIELHGQRLHPEAEVKRAILLAIDRMQARVRAETERCARIAEKRREARFEENGTTEWDTNASYYQGPMAEIYEELDEEDEAIATAIRETPHAEG